VHCSPFIMSSRADMYRQRAADAKKRAAQTKDLSAKKAFEEVARGWLVLPSKWNGLTGRGLPSAAKKMIAHCANKSAPGRRRSANLKDYLVLKGRISFSPLGRLER
jgi:hypothetical protein